MPGTGGESTMSVQDNSLYYVECESKANRKIGQYEWFGGYSGNLGRRVRAMAQSESGHTYYGQGTDGPKVEQQTYLDENSLLFVLIMKNSECTLYSMLYLYPVQSIQYSTHCLRYYRHRE